MSSARPLRGLVWLSVLALATSLAACGRQSEGERCSLLNEDQDCNQDEGRPLYCTPASNLRSGADDVDRCCPDLEDGIDDVRCTPRIGGSGGGSGTGGSGQGGAGGEASASGGSSSAGEACQYNSDCSEPLVCGPTGFCQAECQTDRDCMGDLVCSAEQTCVTAEVSGT